MMMAGQPTNSLHLFCAYRLYSCQLQSSPVNLVVSCSMFFSYGSIFMGVE